MSKERNYGAPSEPAAFIPYEKFVEFDSEELPDVLGWHNGGRYDLHLRVEQVSESKSPDGQDRTVSRFRIVSVDAKKPDTPAYLRKLIDAT